MLVFRVLKAPGIFLQNITAKQPDDKMIEVSITAIKDAFGDEYDRFIGKNIKLKYWMRDKENIIDRYNTIKK